MSYRQYDSTGRELDSFTDKELNPQKFYEVLTLQVGESVQFTKRTRIIRVK